MTRTLLDSAKREAAHAARSLVRAPGFALTALATLSVAIGASVTTMSVAYGVLLRPLPYRDPARLVGAWHDMPAINLFHVPQSVPTYFAYRTLSHTLAGIGLYRATSANVSIPGGSTDPERLDIAGATASLFHVLGAPVLVGRSFTEAEDQPGAAPVVMIGEEFWRSRLGADPRVIGRKLDVDGVSREIVGVLPASFGFPSARTALWTPLNLNPLNPPPAAFTYGSVARLAPGVTIQSAERDLASVLPRAAELYPNFVPGITTRQILEQTKPRPVLTPLRDDITSGLSHTLWPMAGAALLLFVVACFNLGSLSLVRFQSRSNELAIRRALGASDRTLTRIWVTESSFIAVFAAVLGYGAAGIAIALIRSGTLIDIPRLGEVTLDERAAAFAAGLAGFAVLSSAVIPVSRIYRGISIDVTARRMASTRADQRLRRSLVTAQIAVALIVLGASTLLYRSFERLLAVRPGFDASHVATFWISLPRSRYPSDSSVVRLSANLLSAIRSLPGVASVGLTSRLPLEGRGYNDNPMYPEGASFNDTKLPRLHLFTTVDGSYFATLGIPLLSGASFDDISVQREGDAIISRSTAEVLWHDPTGRSVIGKRFRVLPTSRWYRVTGVVADVHDSSLAKAPTPTVYFPQTAYSDSAQCHAARIVAVVVRTSGDPSAISGALRQAVRQLDPSLPIFDLQPLPAALRASAARLRITMLVIGGAAVVILLIGAIGLYGMMAYVVALDRRHTAIRIALGASPRSIALATASDAAAIVGAGIAAGLVVFVVSARLLRALLFGVSAWDPPTLFAASLLICRVGVEPTCQRL